MSNSKPNFAELGREYDVDWRTVKRYYGGYEGKPRHRNKPSKLDKYHDIVMAQFQIKGVKVSSVYEFLRSGKTSPQSKNQVSL